MNKQVDVFFTDHDEVSGKPFYTLVARVMTTPRCVEDALEEAFCATQNIEGSWSIGPTLWTGYENPGYSDKVTVAAPLPIHCGRKYGHRSCMVGDIMRIDGQWYRVAPFGFKAMPPPSIEEVC